MEDGVFLKAFLPGVIFSPFMKIILGVESSCDETSVAVVDGGRILSNVISSQWMHRQFGGVVPEISARAHLRLMPELIRAALDESGVTLQQLDAIAVTEGPGLMGPLLVGVSMAKSLAFSLGIPVIPVNHIESHLYASFPGNAPPPFPFIGLIVSGGHTSLVVAREGFRYELLGQTRDDAAGEAFDKIAKVLGLGYPGGPVVDRLAVTGSSDWVTFPRPMINSDDFDFSFSGLKTAVIQYLKSNQETARQHLPDLCASVQAAITSVLVSKTLKAVRETGIKTVVVAGGVSANSELRKRFSDAEKQHQLRLYLPTPLLSTDNAAMVALLALMKGPAFAAPHYQLTPKPTLAIH